MTISNYPAYRAVIPILPRLVPAALALALTLVGSIAAILPLPVCASASGDYDYGLTAYKMRNYGLAAQYFRKSAGEGNSSALVWLYLGHSYVGSGDRVRAIEAYRRLADDFPLSDEAKIGIPSLLKLSPALASKYKVVPLPLAPQAPTAQAPAPAPVASLNAPLIKRIIVVPPLAGHPPVSSTTVATVRDLVMHLPINVYKYLDKGGATINLAPNIEDKWPGSGDGKKPNVEDSTMGEEPGRTYGHDVHVYEREKERGRNVLKDARDQNDIARCCFHEIGHAMDDIAGNISTTARFKDLVEADLQTLPPDLKTVNAYYCAPGEACAEVIGRILAGSDNEFTSYMSQTRAYLKTKFQI
jgi:tetratricopeptide (TPR) repeat protein